MHEPEDLRVEIEPDGGAAPAPPGQRRLWLALLTCGAAALVAWVALDSPTQPSPQPQPAVSPSLDVQGAVDTALAAVDVVPELATRMPGAWWGLVPADPALHTFGTDAEPFPAGSYEVRVACVGPGAVTVGWSVPSSHSTITLPCHASGLAPPVRIDLSAAGRIPFTVAAGDAAARAGRTVFAVALTDPRTVTAATALGAASGTALVDGTVLMIGSFSARVPAEQPGPHRLTVVCAGSGGLLVELRTDDSATRMDLEATPAGARLELEVATAARSTIDVSLFIVHGDRAEAGCAYRVEHHG